MRDLDVWYARLDVEDRRRSASARLDRPSAPGGAASTSPRRAHATACRRFAKLTARRRRRAADHQRSAAGRPDRGAARRRDGRERARAQLRESCAATAARCRRDRRHLLDQLPLRRPRPQGRRRRQRRHPVLDRAAARPTTTATRCSCRSRRPRPSVLEPFPGPSEYAQPGRAGGRRPAPDAGRQRHLPRLAADRRASTGGSATSTSASCATGRARPTSSAMTPAGMALYGAAVRLDARPRPRPLRRPRSPSRPTWAASDAFDRRDRRVRRGLRRPERARLRRAPRRGRCRPPRGDDRLVLPFPSALVTDALAQALPNGVQLRRNRLQTLMMLGCALMLRDGEQLVFLTTETIDVRVEVGLPRAHQRGFASGKDAHARDYKPACQPGKNVAIRTGSTLSLSRSIIAVLPLRRTRAPIELEQPYEPASDEEQPGGAEQPDGEPATAASDLIAHSSEPALAGTGGNPGQGDGHPRGHGDQADEHEDEHRCSCDLSVSSWRSLWRPLRSGPAS